MSAIGARRHDGAQQASQIPLGAGGAPATPSPPPSGETALPAGYRCEVFLGHERPGLLDRIARLRAEGWGEGLSASARGELFPGGAWREEVDSASYQWAVLSERGELAASTRLTLAAGLDDLPDAEWWTEGGGELSQPFDGPVAWMARKVVAAKHRGAGISTYLTEDQLRWAIRLGARTVLLRANASRSAFFYQQGYRLICPPKPGRPLSFVDFAGFALTLDRPAPAPEP